MKTHIGTWTGSSFSIFNFAFSIVSLLLLAGCGRDDGEDGTGGKLPMAFTCTVDGQAAGRATTDNTWTAGDKIAVQVGSVVKQHEYQSDGSLRASDTDPFYWQDKNAITVTAWYPYSTGKQVVVVQADQSTPEGYNASDFLEATAQTVSYPSSIELKFKHRTVKIDITLVKGDGITDVDLDAADVRLVNLPIIGGNPDIVTPYTSGTTRLALLAPGTIAANVPFIKITTNSNTYNYTPADPITLEGGYRYRYNVTVSKTGIAVSAPGITPWGDPLPGGSGTAEFRPKEVIDLSTESKTINDNDWYLIDTKTGKNILYIEEGSPTVILRDATIAIEAGTSISSVIVVRNGASPTLKIEGTCDLSTTCGGGIVLLGGSNITIEGTDKGSSFLTVMTGEVSVAYLSAPVGIGAHRDETCGDITIRNVTLDVTGKSAYYSGAAAIGTSQYKSACGNITIENSAITATGGKGAAAIGGGFGKGNNDNITVGDITIRNSTVMATVIPYDDDYFGAFIGLPFIAQNCVYSCGKITITTEDDSSIDDFMTGWTFDGSGTKGYKIGCGALEDYASYSPGLIGGVYFNNVKVGDDYGYGKHVIE